MAFGQKRIHMNQWKYPVCIVVRLLQVVKTRQSDVADWFVSEKECGSG